MTLEVYTHAGLTPTLSSTPQLSSARKHPDQMVTSVIIVYEISTAR